MDFNPKPYTRQRWSAPPMHDEPPPGRFDDGDVSLYDIQVDKPEQPRVEQPKPSTRAKITAKPFVWRDPTKMPRRQWVYGQ